jgi:hypothetical protein
MGRRWRWGAAIAAVIAAASAAAIGLARGGGDFIDGGADNFSVVVTGPESTNSKQWKRIPDVGGLFATSHPQGITLSAQMRKGKVKLRMRNTTTDQTLPPKVVTFRAPGSESFSFYAPEACPDSHELQWKRVGKVKAVASRLSVIRIIEGPTGCA